MTRDNAVLIEAESFAQHGGWVLDQQFMDVMGSPFLMAHGLGRPVADATTQASVPSSGPYRVWVRTRDWVAPHGPGRFRVHVNGTVLPREFGVGRGDWHWDDGGVVHLDRQVGLRLEDLTGFNGRCDAVLLVAVGVPCPPPEGGPELRELRRVLLGLAATPPIAGSFDFVVAGGGYAGICAAISAARMGLKVALIQDRAVYGGNASSDIRVAPIGKLDEIRYPRLGDLVRQLHKTPRGVGGSGGVRAAPDDEYVAGMVAAEDNISAYTQWRVTAAKVVNGSIASIVATCVRSGRELEFAAPLYADCTGDGTLGALAGAEFRIGREGADQTGEPLAPSAADNCLLGVSNYWYAAHTAAEAPFGPCPWALPVTQSCVDLTPPKYPPKFSSYAYVAGWNWESGFERDQIHDAEAVRDHNLRAMYGAWDLLKNRSSQIAGLAKARLEWAAYVMGRRESRRLIGDHLLTQQDITERRDYPDGCVTATWYFDLHFPHPICSETVPGQDVR